MLPLTRTRPRLVAPLLWLAAVGALAGCGASGAPEAIDDPRGPVTTTGQAPVDADQIVWQESTAGGFVPIEEAAGGIPDVTIYGDGRILVRDQRSPAGIRPNTLQVAMVPNAALEAFLADAADSGLFEPGTAFGDVAVTDMPSTTVTLHAEGTTRTVDVYALAFAGDLGPTGLTTDQIGRRTALSDLLDRARGLAGDTQPYVPARVRAILVGPGPDAGAKPADWPGPAMTAFPEPTDGRGFTCLVIDGPEAAELAAAAADNPADLWNLDGDVRRIVVAPLVPGQEGCPPP